MKLPLYLDVLGAINNVQTRLIREGKTVGGQINYLRGQAIDRRGRTHPYREQLIYFFRRRRGIRAIQA